MGIPTQAAQKSRSPNSWRVRLCLPLMLCLTPLTTRADEDAAIRPADGIHDGARALNAETHAAVAAEIADLKAQLGTEVWLSAETRGGGAGQLRTRARDLRRAWSSGVDSVLFAYDRAGEHTALSFSPSIWEKNSPAELAAAAMEAGVLMADKATPLEARLAAAMRAIMRRYKAMESARRRVEKPFLLLERRLAAYVTPVLGSCLLVAFLAGAFRHNRRDGAVDEVWLPEVEVGRRFGAPCGGGVVVARQSGMTVET